MKKILLIHNKYRFMGGEDIAVENELNFLKEKFEVETLFFENDITNFLSEIKSFLLNKNSKSVKKLNKKINEFQPDIAYVHNTWFKASVGIFEFLEKQNIQTLLKIHNFRYFCTKNFLAKNHFQDRLFCKACGLNRASMGIFNKYFQDSYLKSLISIRYGKKYFKILKNSNLKILVLTDFHKKYLEKLGVDKSKLYIFRNYLDVNKSIKSANNENYIIYAGRISKEKGVEKLIQAFLKCDFKDTKFKIVGQGPEKDKLKKQYMSNSVEFLDQMSNSEVLNLIKKSIATVTSTSLFEGQPTLLCEASSLGVPSIFPDSGGIKEFFPDDYELVFDYDSDVDLMSKLSEVVSHSNMSNYGIINQEFISKLLDKDQMFKKFEKIISK
mgnify:CR=1 FL=1